MDAGQRRSIASNHFQQKNNKDQLGMIQYRSLKLRMIEEDAGTWLSTNKLTSGRKEDGIMKYGHCLVDIVQTMFRDVQPGLLTNVRT